MNEMNAYALCPAGKPEWETILNASSRGKAKSEYWRHVNDAWEVPFTAIRCRKVGGPVSSPQFLRCAEYRGIPDLRCGHQVRVGESLGVVVGHNESANFNVAFTSGQYAGSTHSVHPDEMVIL